ncbi:MAG: type I secretion system permease/ATPase [Gammaproteobacteria bacterium]|nr:type I secretion system permease/ATPase [Gammaproteobacteria bacterium]
MEEKQIPKINQPDAAQKRSEQESKKPSDTSEWPIQRMHKFHDPLLDCFLIISKLKNRPTSAQSLTAGLPLIENRLTPDLLIRAARRAGFSARIVKKKIKSLSKQHLPSILLLKNQEACILIDIQKNGIAKIIDPESGEGYVEIPIKELSSIYLGYAIFIQPLYRFDETTQVPPSKKSKNWFWNVILRAWPIYGEVVIAAFLINLFTVASPLFILNVYDRVIPNNAVETLWVLASGILIVYVFDFLIRNLRAYFIDSAAKKIDIKLLISTFEQLMGLKMSVRPTSVGYLANTVHAFEAFRDFITSATVGVLVDIPFAFLFLAIVALLGGIIVLIPLTVAPILILSSFLFQIPINKLVTRIYQYAAEKQTVLIESLAGIETLKGMRAENLMQHKWESIVEAIAQLSMKLRAIANLGANFSIYLQQITIVCVIIAGVYQITKGGLTIGALIACTILSSRALSPIAQIAALLTRYKQSKTSLDSIDAIMKMPTERPEDRAFLHRAIIKGDIQFKNVSFAYPDQFTPALTNVSFHIRPGERVGFVGRAGSGKSTIVKLILEFYQPSDGNILIDGTEIQQIDPAELRYHIGYIPQEIVLFHGTIRDNIVISAPYVDDATMIRAAQLSGVDGFVSHHPLGYDRPIFERGQNLSSGQKQAIGIARALLLDPPILIFDEPCKSLDDTSIAQFFQRIIKQLFGKTLILITHRSLLLQLVNRLIVIEQGHLALDGPKDVILKKLTVKPPAPPASNPPSQVIPTQPKEKTEVKKTSKKKTKGTKTKGTKEEGDKS